MSQLKIVYRRLDEIIPLPNNAKLHDLEEIKASIRDHGFLDPIGVNPNTCHDLDGNGRLEALKLLYATGEAAPRNISAKMEDGVPVWYAPTVNLEFDDEQTERIVALRLNRSNEKGGYDKAIVLAILEEADAAGRLAQTGFDHAALENVRAFVSSQEPVNLDDFFQDENAENNEEKKVKIVLKFRSDQAEAVLGELRKHGKTAEEAILSLLGI